MFLAEVDISKTAYFMMTQNFSQVVTKFIPCDQCGGSGSVESISFPWIRIRIKKWLDPTKTIENIK